MKKIEKIKVVHLLDSSPDLSWLGEYSVKPGPHAIDRQAHRSIERNECRYFNPANWEYRKQEYARMEAYNKGTWHCMGIRAIAYLLVGPENFRTVQTIETPGLWGIESDSDKRYLAEIAGEELSTLKDLLLELGFTEADVEAAQPKELLPC